jgi:hypothetical protein
MWLLTSLIPSIGPRTLLAIIGAVLLASVSGLIYLAGVQHEHAKLVALDLQWRLKIEQANRAAEDETNARVQAALEAAASVVVVPSGPDRSGAVRLCDADSDCRDKQQQVVKSRSVQGAKARSVGR